VDRRETFSAEEDRATYLRLLRENLAESEVRVLGWCLMTNHVHLVLVPAREDSLSTLLRRVHGRYAQYYNARWGRTGHLWQSRFFGCVLASDHLWAALAYVERNPVRAGLVQKAAEYRWSSASAHISNNDANGILDMEWWRREAPDNWEERLKAEQENTSVTLRLCTYAGRPFGDEAFVAALGEQFGRKWVRGRPSNKPKSLEPTLEKTSQPTLF
jgi:putative transposase